MSSSKSKDLPPSARGVFGPVSWLLLAVAGLLVAVRFKPEAADYLLAQAGFSNLLDSSRSIEVTDAVHSIKYYGLAKGRVEQFQNIFYARDTSGERRFAPPEPFIPSPGSKVDATKSGAWCPQGTGDILPWTSSVHNVSENCLSLRIARPAGTKSGAKLPVVVFVHGGEGIQRLITETEGRSADSLQADMHLGRHPISSTLRMVSSSRASTKDSRLYMSASITGWEVSTHISCIGSETDAPSSIWICIHGCPTGIEAHEQRDA